MIFHTGREYRTRNGQTAKIERVSPSGYAAGKVGGRSMVWRPGGENATHNDADFDIDFYADCQHPPVIVDVWRVAYPTDWDGGKLRREDRI